MGEKQVEPIKKSSSKRMCDFFLSYSSDDMEFAKHIAKQIEERGLDTWIADTDLKSGENIYDQIRDAINNARFCIILLSSSSTVAKPLVSKEWAAIQECSWRRPELTIYLVLLEDVDTPPFLRSCQAFKAQKEVSSVAKAVDGLIKCTKLTKTHNKNEETEVDKKEIAERFSNIRHLLEEYSRLSQNGGDNEIK